MLPHESEADYYERRAAEELALLDEDLASIEARAALSIQSIWRAVLKRIGLREEDVPLPQEPETSEKS